MWKYWHRVLRRAITDTLRIFSWAEPQRLWLAVAVTFAIIVIVWYVSGTVTAWEGLMDALVRAAAVLVVFLLWLLWRAMDTPRKLELEQQEAAAKRHAEQESQIQRLEKQLDDKAARQAALNKLWALRKKGVTVRNRSVFEAEYSDWEREFDEWRQAVLTEAATITPNLKNWLDTLDRMEPPPDLPRPANDEHDLKRHVMSEMLLRLGRYLEKDL